MANGYDDDGSQKRRKKNMHRSHGNRIREASGEDCGRRTVVVGEVVRGVLRVDAIFSVVIGY